jgi:hypothetical protein
MSMASTELRLRRLERARAAEARPGDLAPVLEVPNIIDFALDPAYLGLEWLYPAQATLLKVIFLATELVTDFDREVIARWSDGFEPEQGRDGTRFAGDFGTPPDVFERIELCKAAGRRWFREIVLVGGRRGSKGFIGGVAGAYIIWRLLALGDPHRHYGIAAGRRLSLMVFAGQQQQALANQFADITQRILHGPCFQPFIAESRRDRLALWTPEQVPRNAAVSEAMIEVLAKESTAISGRGPAAFAEFFDEMAHAQASGANRSAEEVFNAAVPATAQFGVDAFLYEASSPWQKTGQFFSNYSAGLEIDERGQSVNYDTLVLQFPTGELYRGWRDAERVARYPGGETFPRIGNPIWEESEVTERQRRRDPTMYAVEYDAQWATSHWAYLTTDQVTSVFAPWNGVELKTVSRGLLGTAYIAHADPSVSGKNFGVTVAHSETDAVGNRHVIVDLIHVWRPSDFPDGNVDYEVVATGLKNIVSSFSPRRLTLDQFNSAGLLQELRRFVRQHPGLTCRPIVEELTATAGSNFAHAETLKSAVSLGRVHAPSHELLHDELAFLEVRNGRVDHPTRGPIQTSDLADCLMAVTHALLGDNAVGPLIDELGGLGLRGSQPGGMRMRFGSNPYAEDFGRAGRRAHFGHGAARRPRRNSW